MYLYVPTRVCMMYVCNHRYVYIYVWIDACVGVYRHEHRDPDFMKITILRVTLPNGAVFWPKLLPAPLFESSQQHRHCHFHCYLHHFIISRRLFIRIPRPLALRSISSGHPALAPSPPKQPAAHGQASADKCGCRGAGRVTPQWPAGDINATVFPRRLSGAAELA